MQWKIKCVGISDHGAMKTVEFFSDDLKTKLYLAVDAASKAYHLGGEYALDVVALSVEKPVESVDKSPKKK